MNEFLFEKELWDAIVSKPQKATSDMSSYNLGTLHHRLCWNLTFTDRYQMPVVESVSCPIPLDIIGFHRTTTGKFQDSVPHFYIDDTHIERIWKHPYETLSKLLKNKKIVIGPDFSVYSELLFAQKLWNIFRNKLLVAWWQYNGLTVIPNVSWINENYDCSFEGWPKASVIAVNSTGVGDNKRCKAMWIQGYEKMIETLSPKHILRYGAKQAGEIESISTYYPNDNFKMARYGWK